MKKIVATIVAVILAMSFAANALACDVHAEKASKKSDSVKVGFANKKSQRGGEYSVASINQEGSDSFEYSVKGSETVVIGGKKAELSFHGVATYLETKKDGSVILKMTEAEYNVFIGDEEIAAGNIENVKFSVNPEKKQIVVSAFDKTVEKLKK